MNTLLWLVGQNALTVLVVLPLVWFVARLRSSRPAEQHLLWLLLLVKLVTPPVIVWPLSLTELREHFAAAPSEVDQAAEVQLLASVPTEELAVVDAAASASAVDVTTLAQPLPKPTVFDSWWFTPIGIVAALWLLGTATVLTVTFHRILRQRQLVRCTSPAGHDLHQLVGRVAARMRVRPVTVRLSLSVASPCISCLFGTVLIWPASAKSMAAMRCAETVIAHELAHLRRRDHWVSWLELLVLTLWWWNPCFWLIRWKLHETRELACDALALEHCSADRREFADLLLNLSDASNPAFGPASLVGAGLTSRYSLRRRLEMVFNEHASGRTSWVGLALAGLLAVAAIPGWSWGQPAATEPKADSAAAPVPAPPVAAPDAAASAAPDDVDQSADRAGALGPFLGRDPAAPKAVGEVHLDEFVQEIPLATKGIKLQIRRTRDGVLTLEVEEEEEGRKWKRVLSVGDMELPKQSRTARSAAEPPPLPRTRAAARQLSNPMDPDPRDEKRKPSARTSSSSRFSSGWTTEARPTQGLPASDNLAKHDIELAEITLQEKTLELEAAREEAAESGDTAGQRKIKLAELAVRRAQIELEKAKAGSEMRAR